MLDQLCQSFRVILFLSALCIFCCFSDFPLRWLKPRFLRLASKLNTKKKSSKAFNLRPNWQTGVPGRNKPPVVNTLCFWHSSTDQRLFDCFWFKKNEAHPSTLCQFRAFPQETKHFRDDFRQFLCSGVWCNNVVSKITEFAEVCQEVMSVKATKFKFLSLTPKESGRS